MNGKQAKRLRRWAEWVTQGRSKAYTERSYRIYKKVYKQQKALGKGYLLTRPNSHNEPLQ